MIRAIPDGMPCIGRWISRRPSLAELAWRDRQADGKSSGVSEKMMDRIADWTRRHEERERAIAFAHLTPDAAAKAEEPVAAELPAASVIKAQSAGKTQQTVGGSKWR